MSNIEEQKKMECGVEILNVFLMLDDTPKCAYELRDEYWAFKIDADNLSKILSNLYNKGYIQRVNCYEGPCRFSYFVREEDFKSIVLRNIPRKDKGAIKDDCIPKGVITHKD